METKNKDRLIIIILYIVILIPKIIIVCFAYPLQTGSDDTAYFSVPAYLAGYDWSQVVSYAGYYGYGFSWLLTPLFMILDNPVAIYRIAIIACCMVQSGNVSFAYLAFRKYGTNINRKECVLYAIVCSMCITARPTSTSNEFMLECLSWGVVLLLGEIYYAKCWRRRELFSFILAALLSYSLTFHTRALTLIISIIISDFVYFVFTKRKVVGYLYYIAIIVGYYLTKMLNKGVQAVVWEANGKNLRNASVILPTDIDFKNIDTYKTIFSTFLGQICTINIFTGGVFIIGIVLIGSYFLYCKNDEKYIFLTFVFCIFFMAMMATSLVQSVSWSPNNILYWNDIGKAVGTHKAFTYIRYFMPYVGPILCIAFIIFSRKIANTRKVVEIAASISLILLVFWVIVLAPRMQYDKPAAESIPMWCNHRWGNDVEINSFLLPILLFINMVFIILVCAAKKKMKIYFGIAGVLMLLQFIYNTINISFVSSNYNRNRLIHSYEYIIENEVLNKIEKIYVYDAQYEISDTRSLAYYYQFYFFDRTILPNIPKESENALIFCTNEKWNEELSEKYYEIILSQREYLYIAKEIEEKEIYY